MSGSGEPEKKLGLIDIGCGDWRERLNEMCNSGQLAKFRCYHLSLKICRYDPQIEIDVMKASYPHRFLSILSKLRVEAPMGVFGGKSRFIAPPYSTVPTLFIKEVS